MSASGLDYKINFDFTTKGQEQLSAASKLVAQLQQSLQNITGIFQQFGQGAEQSANLVASSQTKVGDSAARVVTELGKEGQAFTQLDTSQTKVTTGMTGLVTNQTKVGDSSTRVVTEMTKQTQTMTALDQTQVKVGQGMTQLVTSQTAVGDTAVKVVTEMDKQNVALTKMDESQKKLATDMGAVTDATTKQAEGVTKGADGMVKLGTETTKVQDTTKKLQGTMKDTASSVKTTGDSVKKMGDNMQETANDTKNLETGVKNVATGTKGLKESFTSLAGGVTSLGSGIINLWQSYDSLGDSQLNVDKAARRLSLANEALATAQAKVNVLTTEGLTGTAEYSAALLNLEQAQAQVGIMTGNLQNAQENLNVTQANFYMQVIPNLMGVIGSLATIYGSATLAVDKFRERTALAGVQTSLTSKLMATISVTNPFFLALTIGGAILAAFVTNLGGFRDGLNGVGVALGNAAGPLKPFLTMIGDLGNGLSKMFGGATDETEAYAATVSDSMGEAGDAFTSYGTTSVSALDTIQKKLQGTVADIRMNQNLLNSFVEAAKTPITVGTITPDIKQQTQPTVNKGAFTGSVNLQPPSSNIQKGSTVPLGTDNPALSSVNLGPNFKQLAKDVDVYADATGKLSFDQAELTKKLQETGYSGAFLQANLDVMNKAIGNVSLSSKDLAKTNIDLYQSTGKSSEQSDKETQALLKNQDAKLKLKAAQEGIQLQTQTYQNSIDASNLSLNSLNATLTDSATYSKMVEDATLKQQVAMKQQQVTIMETTAGLEEYNKQIESSEGKMTAQAQGKLKQIDALVKEKVAVQENIGQYAELQNQLAKGEIQQTAYSNAFYETSINISNGTLEIQKIRGAIAATEAKMKDGTAQILQWGLGFETARQNIQQVDLSLENAAGSMQAYSDALRDGTLQEQARKQASLDYRQSLIDTVTEIESLKQNTTDYGVALKDGIPQSLAFAKAFIEQTASALKLDETLAGLEGTYMALKNQSTSAATQLELANIAFINGSIGAEQWAQSLKDSQNQNQGFLSGLDLYAKGLGTTIPQAFMYSNQAAQDWIAIQMRMPDAIAKGLKKAVEDGKQSIDDLTEAWDKGNNLSKKEVNKILGENIPDSYRKKIDYEIEINVNEAEITDRLNKSLAILTEFRPDTKAQAQGVVDDLMGDLQEAFRNGKVSEEFNNNIVMMMGNMPDPKDIPAWDAWIAEFKLLQEAIASGDPEKIRQTITAMTERQEEIAKTAANIKNYEDAIKSVSDNIDTYLANIKGKSQLSKDDVTQSTGLIEDLSSGFANLGNEKSKQIKQQNPDMDNKEKQGQTKVDTSAIDEAMAKLNALNLALGAIQGTVTTVVSNSNIEFAKLNPLQPAFSDGMTTIAEALKLLVEGVAATVDEINTDMGLIGSTFNGATQVTKPITDSFKQARANSQPYIIGIGDDFAKYVVGKILTDTKGLGGKVVAEFESMRSGIIDKFNAIGTAAHDTFEQILGYVSAVTSELKSVPSVIDVEYRVRVTGDTPPGQAASGFTGLVTGAHTITVGEAGPEFVSIVPLKGSKMPGGTRSMAAQGFQGVVGVDTTSDTTTTSTGIPGTQAGVQDVRIVGLGLQSITGGSMPVYITGSNISLGGSGSGSGSGSGGIGTGTSTGGGLGSGGSIGSGSGGTGTGTGQQTNQQKYWVTENGTQYYWENNNGVIRTNMDANMLSRYHLQAPSNSVEGSMGPVGSGIYPGANNGGSSAVNQNGTGGGGGGGGGSSQTNTGTNTGGMGTGTGTGGSTTTRPQTDADGLYGQSPNFGGTADVGISPAIRNKVKQKPGINMRNEVELVNGDRYSVDEWNNLSDSKRKQLAEKVGFFAIPEGSYLNEDYSISEHYYQRPSGSTTTGRNNGGGMGSGTGTGGGGNYSDPEGTYGGSVIGDKSTLGSGGPDYYKTGTGYNVPSYIQTPQHGAHDSSKWNNANYDPRTWSAKRMVDDPNLWKVVDDKGINIAAGFVEEDQANEFIQEHIFTYHQQNGTPAAAGGTGTTTPVNQNGTGGTNTGTGGMGTGTGTGTGTGGGSSTYTVPSGVITSDPIPDDPIPEWTDVDTSDPNTWKVERMADPFTTGPMKGQRGWKVMTNDGKNIAIRFETKEQADEYIRQHQTAKEKGVYTSPTAGGGTLTYPSGTGTGTGGMGTGTGGTGTGTGTGTGGAMGSVIGDPKTLGPGGEGYYQMNSTGYMVPGYAQSPDHGATNAAQWTGANYDPRTWSAKPMVNDPNLWKVVDDKGINIIAKLKSEDEANEFIQEWLYAAYGSKNPQTPGTGNGGTGTGTGTGTGGVNQDGTGGTSSQGGMTTVPSPYDQGMQVVQINDNGQQLFWKKQNGVITTNMSSAQLAKYGLQAPSGTGTGGSNTSGGGGGGGFGGAGGNVNQNGTGGLNIGGISFPAGFPFQNTPKGPGGGPVIGGIEFPAGFPFNNTSGGGGFPTTGGGGGGSTQTTTRPPGNGMYIPIQQGFGDNMPGVNAPGYTNGVLWPSGGIYTQPYPVSQTGTGGVSTSSSTQTRTNTGGNFNFTDANGNNFNGQNDVNNQSNVLVPNGGINQVQTMNQGNNSSVPMSTGTGQVITPSGTIINRSQTVSQTSTGGGQSYYYQNQDGNVNTNFPGGQLPDSLRNLLDMFGLGNLFPGLGGSSGGGGGGGSGTNVGNRPIPGQLDVRTGIDNTVPIYDVGPVQEGRDYATQRIQATTPGKPGKPGGGGLDLGDLFGNISGWMKGIMEMIMGRVKDGLGALKMDINLDGQSIFKSYSLDLMRRYNAQF